MKITREEEKYAKSWGEHTLLGSIAQVEKLRELLTGSHLSPDLSDRERLEFSICVDRLFQYFERD